MVLLPEAAAICDQIFDDRNRGQRSDRYQPILIYMICERRFAGQHICAVDVHRAATADPVAAGAPKGKAAILLFFDLEQGIQDSLSGYQFHLQLFKGWFLVNVGVKSFNA